MTYNLSLTDPPSIVCYLCNRRSYNPNDIRHRYCGWCHIFHDDERTIAVYLSEDNLEDTP